MSTSNSLQWRLQRINSVALSVAVTMVTTAAASRGGKAYTVDGFNTIFYRRKAERAKPLR